MKRALVPQSRLHTPGHKGAGTIDQTGFKQALAARDWPHSAQMLAQFQRYYDELIAANQKMNLTALTSVSDVYLKHFYDSLTLVDAAPQVATPGLTLCDVGAGAGFPSLPVKLLYPTLDVTIVDSLKKRIDFLSRLTNALGVSVQLFHDRAETFGAANSPHREQYDLVTARAVAALPTLVELCLPLVKIGGQFVAMKGSRGTDEVAAAQTAIKQLGGEWVETLDYALPESGDARTLVVIKKVEKTPRKYPRKPGTPAKLPLGG